jgi:hypothetical protein
MHLATLVNNKHCHALRTPRSPSTLSTPPGPAQSGDPDTGKRGEKRGHQDLHTKTSSETHHSVNTNNDHNTCNTGDEDARPVKRQKPRSTPAATLTTYCRQSPGLRLAPPGPLVTPSSTRSEIGGAQPQVDHAYSSNFVDKSYDHASRTSRSPSAALEAVLATEYQE